ncbi:hypothetical protein QUF07_02105 [Lentilactobacillus sp. TOM.63]|uniref:hypothetical protein n=1 Tax=Lentilactobacillus sp. TOM.63 TaxID=3055077 RepID=UPI0025A3043A|nr:hypothetical protein [Lentilactobacillus sp. TOM.63]MDM7515497.1 hypothetical protein [Lentilactobacillus sp. TOM.63]
MLQTEDVQVARENEDELYLTDEITWSPTNMKLIPYYAWANRAEGQMQVWQAINR